MPEYEIAYRLHSSATINAYGSIGDATIRKRGKQSGVDGELVFTVEAEGVGKLLDMTLDGKYRYSPPPDWFTATHEAILQYTYAAGWVPLEIITRNVNAGEIDHVRSDVEADEETVQDCCVDLVDLDLLEEEVGEYSITIDGENVLKGKIGLEGFEQPG